MKLTSCIEHLLSIPKSFYVSARLCGLRRAFYLPVLVRYNTVIRTLNGCISAQNWGGIRIGLSEGEGTLDRRNVRCVLEIDGEINVSDKLIIGRGSRICVGHNAILKVKRVFNTSRLHLICTNEMHIGKNVLIAWDTTLMDSDMHSIINLENNQLIPKSKKVFIDDNVWIGTRSIILKGTHIPTGSIIGAGSVVAGKFNEKNSVIAGNPAKVIKSGFTRYE